MRLRNVKGSQESIASNEFVIQEPESLKGKWNEFFGNHNPIHIEIGMGKGKFLTQLATQNPNINYIGIEKYSSVLIRATQKRQEVDIQHLLLKKEQNWILRIYFLFDLKQNILMIYSQKMKSTECI